MESRTAVRSIRRVVGSSVLFAFISIALFGCVRRGSVVDVWESSNGAIKIRVTKYDETPKIIVPHTYFGLEAAVPGSSEWREVLQWKVDDPIPIQRQQVRFVAEHVAYAFGNATFVVTTDGGRTWTDWDAAKHLGDLNPTMISDVHIGSDGAGWMKVKRRAREDDISLTTQDFGKSWREERKAD